MGAGASAPRDQAEVAESKDSSSRQEKPTDFFEASPFDDVGCGGESGLGMSAAPDKPSLSAGRLKKLALGLPGYKEVDRDYNATLEELEFNKAQVSEWVTPPEGFGDRKPERLVDDYPYGRGSGNTTGAGIKHPHHDARAAAGRGGGAPAAGRTAVATGPGGRPRPPPPRRPSNPSAVIVPTPTTAVASSPQPHQPASLTAVEAPSVIPRPRAALETAPAMGNSGVNKQYWPAPGAAPAVATAAASLGIDATDRSPVSSAQSYRKLAGGVLDSNGATPPPSRGGGAAGRQSAQSSSPSPGKPSLPDAPKEQPPNVPSRPFPGGPGKTTLSVIANSHSGATDADGDADPGDDIYATFAPAQPQTPESKRPTIVPLLAMREAGPSSGSTSASSSSSSSSSAASSYKLPSLNVSGVGSGAGTHAAPPSQSSPLPRPSQPRHPSISGPTGAGSGGTGTGTGAASGRASATGTGAGAALGSGASSIVRSLDPVTGAVTKSTANPAPKPASKLPHEVKETTDVKRNRAHLPEELKHNKPTTGDWLKKRYIVNNYILLDVLGVGSYGEVRMCKDRTSEQLFAIKIISKDLLRKKKNGHTSETYFEDIRREIAIMKKLKHPNVLRLFEVLDDPNVNKMYLVLEYMKRGDLINILKTRVLPDGSRVAAAAAGAEGGASTPGATEGPPALTAAAAAAAAAADPMKSGFVPLSDFELYNIFRQVAAGVRYLHYQNIVHGDIKVSLRDIERERERGRERQRDRQRVRQRVRQRGAPALIASRQLLPPFVFPPLTPYPSLPPPFTPHGRRFSTAPEPPRRRRRRRKNR